MKEKGYTDRNQSLQRLFTQYHNRHVNKLEEIWSARSNHIETAKLIDHRLDKANYNKLKSHEFAEMGTLLKQKAMII